MLFVLQFAEDPEDEEEDKDSEDGEETTNGGE